MVLPKARREVLKYWRTTFPVSEGQACKLAGIERGVSRSRRTERKDGDIRAALVRLVGRNPATGMSDSSGCFAKRALW